MNQIFDLLCQPYLEYRSIDIVLEFFAVLLGILSVWFAKNNNILVYLSGMISTAIFVYLLLKFDLLGDMLINAYYFFMSCYGLYFWTYKEEGVIKNKISTTSFKEYILSLILFIMTLIFVRYIYQFFDICQSFTAYIDTLTTAIFFVGMMLMARRKIEHWIFWIVGNLISIPLYFYKGLTLTSIQYIIFTVIAIFGYISWKRKYQEKVVLK